MIGPRAVIGLSLLCALLFSAAVAQSASAAKAVNTTAATCIKGVGNEDFSDAHCDEFVGPGEGSFGHAAITLNETKELDATNETTGGATTPIVLRGKANGAAVEIECASMATTTNKSAVHNVEAEAKHTMTGNGTALFSKCTVKKPAKCIANEPIEADANFEGVEGLGEKGNEMGVEFKGAGEGGKIAAITFANKGAESCALNGKTFNVAGSAIGTSKVSQTTKYTGATIVFSPENGMESITFGGVAAEVTMTTTPKGAGGGGHPISITTTT